MRLAQSEGLLRGKEAALDKLGRVLEGAKTDEFENAAVVRRGIGLQKTSVVVEAAKSRSL